MTRMDWPGLLRLGLERLQLRPKAFWRLTPIELRLMLGEAVGAAPLSRKRLAELAAEFPDSEKEPKR